MSKKNSRSNGHATSTTPPGMTSDRPDQVPVDTVQALVQSVTSQTSHVNAGSAVSPTVTTDKADYAPGDTVQITLEHVRPGAAYTIQIADAPEDPGDDGVAVVYPAFSVVDGGAGDLDGIKNGKIVTEWIVPTDGSPDNATLNLTATNVGRDGLLGTTDDIVLTTTFTDAKPGASGNLDQWATGPAPDAVSGSNVDKWVNGNLNANQAHYSEDFYIPYRDIITNTSTNTTYFLTIRWDVAKAGLNALDYIGTFNQRYENIYDANPETVPNPTTGVTKLAASTHTLDIIADPYVTANTTNGQEAGHFTLYGNGSLVGYALAGADHTWGTSDDIGFLLGANGVYGGGDDRIVSAGVDRVIGTADDVVLNGHTFDDVYVYSAGSNLDSDASREITVLLRSGGGTNNSLVLAWGGHIASQYDWGVGNSAVEIPGSPYHMAVVGAIGITDVSFVQTNVQGNQDRSLASTAVIPSPPVVPENLGVVVDDDDVAGANGIPGGVGDLDEANLTGTLAHDYGSSGSGSLLLTGTAPLPTGYSAAVTDGGLTLTIYQDQNGSDVPVIVVALADDINGIYTVTHPNVIIHPSLDGQPGDNQENNVTADAADFVVTYTVTSGNGLSTPGTLGIIANDDTPNAPTVVLSGTEPIALTFDGGLTGGRQLCRG